MSHYRTITGREIDLGRLTHKERDTYGKLILEYRKDPEWTDFSDLWIAAVRALYPRKKRGALVRTPLYRIGQDLEMQLGIRSGRVARPDYRDYLVDGIDEKYGSRYKFCKETGFDEAYLSQVLSGKRNLSIDKLKSIAEHLGWALTLLPSDSFPLDERFALTTVTSRLTYEIAELESLGDQLSRIRDRKKWRLALENERTLLSGPVDSVVAGLCVCDEETLQRDAHGVMEREIEARTELHDQLRKRLAQLAEGLGKSDERITSASI